MAIVTNTIVQSELVDEKTTTCQFKPLLELLLLGCGQSSSLRYTTFYSEKGRANCQLPRHLYNIETFYIEKACEAHVQRFSCPVKVGSPF